MDFSTIIVAALALVGTLVGTYFSNNKTTGLILYRMEQLEKKVEKHNTVIERTYKLERDLSTAFTKIDNLREEIHNLEH